MVSRFISPKNVLILALFLAFPSWGNDPVAPVEGGPAAEPLPQTRIEQPPAQPEVAPITTSPDPMPEQERPKAKALPACLAQVVVYGVGKPGETPIDVSALNSPKFGMSSWRSIFGSEVTSTECDIEEVVVAFDAAVASGSTNTAKHIIIEHNLTEMFTRGLPFAVDFEDLWFIVEYAAIRMRVAENRVGILGALMDKLAQQDQQGEKATAIKRLIEDEWNAYYEQAWFFGRYFKFYFRLRKHITSVMRNESCNSHCKRTARWVIEEVGTRDLRMLALRSTEDRKFNDALRKAGVTTAECEDLTEFTDLVNVANLETLRLVDPGALPDNVDDAFIAARVPGSNVPMRNLRLAFDAIAKGHSPEAAAARALAAAPEAVALEFVAPLVEDDPHHHDEIDGNTFQDFNVVDAVAMVQRSFDPYIAQTAFDSEKRLQMYAAMRGLFQKPVLMRAGLTVLQSFPGGGALAMSLANSAFGKWLFSRQRDTELNRNYSYGVTRMNRNPYMSAEDRLEELRSMSARRTEDDPDGEGVFELVARRTDTLEMWMSLVREVESQTDPIMVKKNADLKAKILKWEEKRAKGELVPLSPTFRVSPFENFVRFSAYSAAAAVYLYYNGLDLGPMAAPFISLWHAIGF